MQSSRRHLSTVEPVSFSRKIDLNWGPLNCEWLDQVAWHHQFGTFPFAHTIHESSLPMYHLDERLIDQGQA